MEPLLTLWKGRLTAWPVRSTERKKPFQQGHTFLTPRPSYVYQGQFSRAATESENLLAVCGADGKGKVIISSTNQNTSPDMLHIIA